MSFTGGRKGGTQLQVKKISEHERTATTHTHKKLPQEIQMVKEKIPET